MPFDRDGNIKRPPTDERPTLSREQVRETIKGAFPTIQTKAPEGKG